VAQATEDYLETEDVFAAWLHECCEQDPHGSDLSTDFYQNWKRYAENAGEIAGSQKKFSDRFKILEGVKKDRDSTTGKVMIFGYRLKRQNYDQQQNW